MAESDLVEANVGNIFVDATGQVWKFEKFLPSAAASLRNVQTGAVVTALVGDPEVAAMTMLVPQQTE